MKNVFKQAQTFCALILVSLLSSCAASHWGYMTTNGALNTNNFSYVRQNVKGEATVTYILGIGGLSRETLVSDAKQQMLLFNPLKSNQALVNLTVNFKISNYLFYLFRSVTCTVMADVVEFGDLKEPKISSENIIPKIPTLLEQIQSKSSTESTVNKSQPNSNGVQTRPSEVFSLLEQEQILKMKAAGSRKSLIASGYNSIDEVGEGDFVRFIDAQEVLYGRILEKINDKNVRVKFYHGSETGTTEIMRFSLLDKIELVP